MVRIRELFVVATRMAAAVAVRRLATAVSLFASAVSFFTTAV